MKVFFDNCTAPVMAHTLHGFISNDGHEAVHLRDLPLAHPNDVEWIRYLAQDGVDWIVITGDGRIRKNKPEREAFRQARLKGIVLAPAFQKTPMSRCCAVLVDRWPYLLDTMGRFNPPVLFEMGIKFSGKFTQLTMG
jgi:hypothetical protein